MGLKTRLILIMILGLLISAGTYTYLSSIKETIQVVVAVQDILPRTKITPNMVKTIVIGKREGNLLAPKAFSRIEQVVGLSTKTKIDAGELLKADPRKILYGPDIARSYAAGREADKRYFVPEHMRVTGVTVDSQGSAGDELKRGDLVDVIYTSKEQGSTAFAVTIIQHVEVFSISGGDEGGLKEPQVINLLVTPQQAGDLALAKRNGSIDLVLNPSGGEIAQPLVATPNSLLKGKK